MTIAVNAAFLKAPFLNSYTHFVVECFTRITKAYPQHNFIFICDDTFDTKNLLLPNVITIVNAPQIKNILLAKYWLNYKLPTVLSKHQAKILVSFGNCSLRCTMPQYLVVNDLSFLHTSNFLHKKWLTFYKNNMFASTQKASAITAPSNYVKNKIAETYQLNKDKIFIVPLATDAIFFPLNWQLKEKVKQQFSFGKEYFLYVGEISSSQNLINLLKAFSFFKTRQRSNMQLLLASTYYFTDNDFKKSLSNFKYKNEVLIFDNLSNAVIAQLTAASYAVVYPMELDDASNFLLNAMQAGTAIIASDKIIGAEEYSNATLQIDANDFNAIADKMMLIFKDENLRNQCIEDGLHYSKKYTWDNTATLLWNLIEKNI